MRYTDKKAGAKILYRPHPVGGIVFAALDLAGQVNAGSLPQAEGREVVAEILLAQPRTDLDKAGVAADGQALGEGFHAVDMAVGTAESGARHLDLARADKGVLRSAHAGVQGGGRRDQLENTARLIQIADGLVAPLRLLGLLQGGAACLPCQRIHRGPGFLVDDLPGRVGVVVRLAGHRQHRAGVHIHNDTHPPLGHMVFPHRGVHGALQPVLDVGVDGQCQRIAGHCLHQRLVMGGHIIAPGIFGGEDPPVPAGQFRVVFQLQAPQPGVVHIGKAQHTAHEIPLGIDALGVLPDLDALGPVFHAPAAHRVGHLPVHTPPQQAVVGGALAELLQRFLVINLQDLTQRPGSRLHQRIGQFPGRGADRPAGLAGGQQGAVRRNNLPPGSRQRGPAQLLVRRTGRIAVGVQRLQHKEPHQQPPETDRPHGRRQNPRTPAHRPVLPRRQKPHRRPLLSAGKHKKSPLLHPMPALPSKCRNWVFKFSLSPIDAGKTVRYTKNNHIDIFLSIC